MRLRAPNLLSACHHVLEQLKICHLRLAFFEINFNTLVHVCRSISTMMQMGLPHVNVLTKCDKIANKDFLDRVSEATSCRAIVEEQMDERNFFNKKFFKLNQVIVDVVDNFSMMNF